MFATRSPPSKLRSWVSFSERVMTRDPLLVVIASGSYHFQRKDINSNRHIRQLALTSKLFVAYSRACQGGRGNQVKEAYPVVKVDRLPWKSRSTLAARDTRQLLTNMDHHLWFFNVTYHGLIGRMNAHLGKMTGRRC